MTCSTVVEPCARCRQAHRRYARGLCGFCHRRAERDGTLPDWPRLTRASADVLEDYRVACLRMPHATIAQRAELIGMSASALRKALERARARQRRAAREES